MRQVTIALATVCQPEFVIADEPTTALDVVVQKDVLAMIRDVQRQMGSSVVFVTHDMSVHANTADRIGIMYAGRLVEEGPTHALRRTTASLHRPSRRRPATHRRHHAQTGARGTTAQPRRTAHGLPLHPRRRSPSRSARPRCRHSSWSAWIIGRRAGAAPTCLRSPKSGPGDSQEVAPMTAARSFSRVQALRHGRPALRLCRCRHRCQSLVVVRRLRDLHDHRRVRVRKDDAGADDPRPRTTTSGDILFEGKSNAERRNRAAEPPRRVQPVFQNPFETFNPLKRVDRYLYASARRLMGARPRPRRRR